MMDVSCFRDVCPWWPPVGLLLQQAVIRQHSLHQLWVPSMFVLSKFCFVPCNESNVAQLYETLPWKCQVPRISLSQPSRDRTLFSDSSWWASARLDFVLRLLLAGLPKTRLCAQTLFSRPTQDLTQPATWISLWLCIKNWFVSQLLLLKHRM